MVYVAKFEKSKQNSFEIFALNGTSFDFLQAITLQNVPADVKVISNHGFEII